MRERPGPRYHAAMYIQEESGRKEDVESHLGALWLRTGQRRECVSVTWPEGGGIQAWVVRSECEC